MKKPKPRSKAQPRKKPVRKTKGRGKAKEEPEKFRCEVCMCRWQMADIRWLGDEFEYAVCPGCVRAVEDEIAQVKAGKEVAPGKLWYVLCCEAGQDDRVRRDILRKAKIDGLYPHGIHKVVVPRGQETAVRGPAWQVLGRKTAGEGDEVVIGWAAGDDADDALWQANRRYGKDFEVTEVRMTKEGNRQVTARRRLFPGYVLVEMAFDHRTHHLLGGVRGTFGLLPLKPSLKGKKYNRGEPATATKPRPWETEKNVTWRPTSVASEEAALVLLRNQESKTPKKIRLGYGQGDLVDVTGGVYAGLVGTVRAVGGSPDDPLVDIEVKVLGQPITVPVKHHLLEKKS